jgi:hypothetical protein
MGWSVDRRTGRQGTWIDLHTEEAAAIAEQL